ncbi:hypothetical protein V498_08154 [Pseudogymnoascus sp. VKM F-4517 (FW-2822)]|nr:hypothetical protein V498_08154 [Pseudogymnoascus sp. VKM F-4517 (FW-2822)]
MILRAVADLRPLGLRSHGMETLESRQSAAAETSTAQKLYRRPPLGLATPAWLLAAENPDQALWLHRAAMPSR